jgi:F0F1-type ATP synthase membrane subunit a
MDWRLAKMDSELFKLMATQGAFAILFSYLLFYVLKENSKREDKYQNIIEELTELLLKIKEDVEDIKEKLNK